MRNYGSYEAIDVDRVGDVLTITLLGGTTSHPVEHTELSQVFSDIRSDDVRVVVLTGTGDYFLPLAPMDWFAGVDEVEWLRLLREAKWLIDDMLALRQPLIVAMNGDAVGLGASIVSCGDIIVAVEGCTITDSHVSMALVAGDGGTSTFPLSMGVHRAKQFYLLNQAITAEELHDMGIVARVVTKEQFAGEVAEMAATLSKLPSEAVQWTKASLNRLPRLSALLGLDSSVGHEGWSWHLQASQARMDLLRERHRRDG
jgi:enoyl-CoA hydratase/carnithine racemase